MALRVLLADESITIKKVIQLALQDFAVEVKAVPVGDDVLAVAQSFQPQLIFIDVLLAKKSGYDVCIELRNNPNTTSIPLILMWSGFMELDEAKTQAARVDRRLEKPFDAETLRQMVRELVPSTTTNDISKFLSFPNLPQFEEKSPAPQQPIPLQTAPPAPAPMAPKSSTPPPAPMAPPSMDDEPDDFEIAPPPRRGGNTEPDQWAAGALTGLPLQNLNYEPLKLNQDVLNFDDAPISVSSGNGELQEIQLSDIEDLPTKGLKFSSKNTNLQLDPTHAEQLIREQVREVLQSIAWQILPDIAEKIVREEIQKLLKESDRL